MGVNPIFFKHIECLNFQTITVMYKKVYISGMEMSQKIYFWYEILLKILIYLENGQKNTFLVKKFCDKETKMTLS